jgi:hypothetical protein
MASCRCRPLLMWYYKSISRDDEQCTTHSSLSFFSIMKKTMMAIPSSYSSFCYKEDDNDICVVVVLFWCGIIGVHGETTNSAHNVLFIVFFLFL